MATAALRDAPGRDRLIARLSAAAGVPVEVLSGEEEARLAFAGATAPLAGNGVATVVVADVGGGSTELAHGAPGAVPGWWASLPIGSGALAESFDGADPPTRRAGRRRARRGPRRAAHASAARRPRSRGRSAAARRRCAGSAARS